MTHTIIKLYIIFIKGIFLSINYKKFSIGRERQGGTGRLGSDHPKFSVYSVMFYCNTVAADLHLAIRNDTVSYFFLNLWFYVF